MLHEELPAEHQSGGEERSPNTNGTERNATTVNTGTNSEITGLHNNTNNNNNNNNNNINNIRINVTSNNAQAARVTAQEHITNKSSCTSTTNTVNHAERRLMRDLRSLQKSMSRQESESANVCNGHAAFGISAHPVKDNLFLWHAIISGPGNSPWEGGLFRLELQFSESYPLQPPNVRFLTPNVFHPNVYVNGHICLDTLKSKWNPALDVESLLISITSLLTDPNPSSAANGEAACMLVENVNEYNRRIRDCVESSLLQEFSESDCSENDDDDDENDNEDEDGKNVCNRGSNNSSGNNDSSNNDSSSNNNGTNNLV